MKLVVGLGNPGRKYEGTRHNVGFEVISELARRAGSGRPREDFQAELWDAQIGMERALLMRPRTFMNLSGSSVVRARDFYKLENNDLLVVCDDFNLPLGKLRARSSGSAGGQKGLKDVIRCLGTDEFARLRIGIGEPPRGWEGVDYVLAKFTPGEQPEIELAVIRAAEAAETWIKAGIDACMNQFNSST